MNGAQRSPAAPDGGKAMTPTQDNGLTTPHSRPVKSPTATAENSIAVCSRWATIDNVTNVLFAFVVTLHFARFFGSLL